MRVVVRASRRLARRVILPGRAMASRLGFRLIGAEPRFVIVTAGRTGSELLVSLLSSHPKIVCEGEIMSIRRFIPSAFLLRRGAMARLSGRAYGFKLLPDQARLQFRADPAGYIRSLHENGFRIIHLERRDWLQQAISVNRALTTQFHFRRGESAGFVPIRVDPVAVLTALSVFEDRVTFLRAAVASLPTLELVYEDDLETEEQQARTVDRICAHLGLPTAPVQAGLVKLTPRSVAEQVENFDDVVALVGATRFAWVLSADRTPAGPSSSGSISGPAHEPGSSLDLGPPLAPRAGGAD
jgi:LPS sulfotransferase NodH